MIQENWQVYVTIRQCFNKNLRSEPHFYRCSATGGTALGLQFIVPEAHIK